MACAHFSAAIVQRSKGGSAVGAAAYAARVRMVDAKTGRVFDYSADQGDVMFSGVFLPKGAPERLRDLAALSNAMEAREKRKDAQTARKFIVALPHELTPQQREWLVQDIGKENFTRKGLGFHVAIHRPHAHGDERNFHAHFTVGMRSMDATGFTEKHLESDTKEALYGWRKSVEKLTNRHLERHGHEARISMDTLEAQGIDRMPQIHLGQAAAAQERKGLQTERGDRLRDIVNDNERLRVVSNEQGRTVGKEFISRPPRTTVQEPQDWTAGKLFAREEIKPPQRAASNDNRPETIDRDAQTQAAQDAIDSAAIAYAEERRRQLQETQAEGRAASERQGEAMAARHSATWGRAAQRHHAELAAMIDTASTGYQPGTMAEAEQAVSGGVSFLLGLFASWAESITRSVSGSSKGQARPKRKHGPDRAKEQQAQRQAEQLREAHTRELEAMLQEQARERADYERRKALMLFQQAGAMQSFEQSVQDKSSMREAFERHTEVVEAYKARDAAAEQKPGRNRGPELA